MSTTTTNYGLIKPDTSDPILIGQINDNMDTIDTVLKDHSDKIDAAALGIKFKGEVNYYSNLPNDAEIGDAYTVKYAGSSGTTPDGTEYVWGAVSGVNQWINFSKDSYSKAEVDALLSLKANADNTAYKTATTSFSGTNMQCVFEAAMFTVENRRGSVLMMFGSQKTSVNNTLLMIDFNDAGIRSIRRLTDGASEVITAIGSISDNKQSFAFTADADSYTYPCLISMFADKDIKPNFTIVTQT